MPKCHKIYPNCIWQVPTEWHTLGFYLVLLSEVYWNYATHIVRVCVTPISPQTSILDFNDKSNLQVHFGSKIMASLYDLLCYHSLTPGDPLLEEVFAYLPTRFHSHIFDFIACEHYSDEESVRSNNFSVSAFYSDDSPFFPEYLLLYYFFLMQLQIFYHGDGHKTVEKGRRPRTTDDPKEGSRP